MKIEIIFAEFGKAAPEYTNILKYFPEAKFTVYTEDNCPDRLYDRNHPRWGHRMNDYYKAFGLIKSTADIAIAFDSDMHIVSNHVRAILCFAEKFGLCLPANPRKLVRIDAKYGADGDPNLDETNGNGYAYNCSPIAYSPKDPDAMLCINKFLEIMRKNPVRGPLAWYRAAYETGFNPYLLPPNFCVCAEDTGIGNEIILHKGHYEVRRYYKILD